MLNILKNNFGLGKEEFNLYVSYLGSEPKNYYKKKKNEAGEVVKDANGIALREEVSSGYSYRFVSLYDLKIVNVVFDKKLNLELTGLYKVSGLGYHIKKENFVFIDENSKIFIDEEIKSFYNSKKAGA